MRDESTFAYEENVEKNIYKFLRIIHWNGFGSDMTWMLRRGRFPSMLFWMVISLKEVCKLLKGDKNRVYVTKSPKFYSKRYFEIKYQQIMCQTRSESTDKWYSQIFQVLISFFVCNFLSFCFRKDYQITSIYFLLSYAK